MTYSNSRIYKAHPLNIAKQSIRLLNLLPGTGRQQLCMKLQVRDLDDTAASDYICLSYVWGTKVAAEAVEIDTEELSVTLNLLSCLQHLRHPQETRILWVDAICINQNDLKEKLDQVAMMGEIYSRCSTVYIWLGVPPKSTSFKEDPFKFMQHFSDNKHYHDLPGFYRNELGQMKFEEIEDFINLWESFLFVVNSAWWTRAWTVQEVVMPSDSVLCYGNWRSTFDTFIIARRNRNLHLFGEKRCCEESLKAFPKSRKTVFDLFLSQIEWIEGFRQADLAEDHPLSSKSMSRPFPEYDYRPFYEIVLTFSNRLCSEPRDRIYSVLAMAKSSAMKSYRPDYSAKLADSYTQAFRLMLKETGNDYRCMIGPTFSSERLGLPSWVPNFSDATPLAVIEVVIRRILLSTLFNASNGEVGEPRYNHGTGLFVAGLRADTVTAVSSVLESVNISPDRLKVILMEWSTLCEKTIGVSEKAAVRTTLSRVICASTVDDGVPLYGCHRGWRRIKEIDLPKAEEWQQFMNGNLWALEEGYRGTLEIASTGRSLYITENGGIGLCYPKVKPGDEVWVLAGSSLPFILRNAYNRQFHVNGYHFIGDCYLEGVMDGEAVQATEQRTSVLLI